MRAKFGLVPTAVSKMLSFKFISRLAGYPASLETLSPGLSPPPSLVPLSPLSYSSLSSTLPPSDYPASLRITAFPRYFLNLEA